MKQLIAYIQKPPVYTKGTAEMWVDPHISRHLLAVHLNPDIDLASRKKATISDTVDWLLGQVPGENLAVLDLGCGPGLYTERIAGSGHQVTGMDYSLTAIEYASRSARNKALDLSYVHQNYLTLREENKYDLIIMIFTDFGVLVPGDRDRLLENIYRALKPGGTFIFDVLNERFLEKPVEKSWQAEKCGFWRETPHLALSDAFLYEEEKVVLSQHVVVEDTGAMDVYRFWTHVFSHDDLRAVTASQGFEKTRCHDDLLPDSEMYSGRDVTFCVTVKPE
ncbi:MAG: class I SAM-dependent methyltransferase [Desulfobacter sp.]|nr:MAG: class I SAM-dependent methyltransferase [Desulfobacter sp.]